MAKVTRTQPTSAAGALHQFWRAGRDSLARLERLGKQDPGALQHGRKKQTYEQEAAAAGMNPDTLAKARRVAEEYTEAEMRALDAAVKKHDAPFSPTHLIRLLALKDRQGRDRLAGRAIKGGWSVQQLKAAVLQAKGGRRAGVGRKPRLPADPGELERDLQGLCLRWTNWVEAAEGRLPKALQSCVGAARKAVEAVARALEDRRS
jgi:hypothetical protein